MAQVTRVYDTHQKATDAVAALKEKGFSEDTINLTTRPAEPAAAAPAPSEVPPTTDPEVDPPPAATPATHYIVSVAAAFGWAQTAEDTLDRFDPLPVVVQGQANTARLLPRARATRDVTGDNAAPLSSALGLPTLIPFKTTTDVRLMPDAAPLSNKLGMKVLSPDRPRADPLPSDWSLSGMFGMPLLSSDPAPLSTVLGRSVLTEDPAPLSRKAKWRVLLDDPTPLSSRLHWKTLTDNQ